MSRIAGVVAGLLSCSCVVPYLRDVLRGTTKPQRTSWLIFAAVAWLAAASQWSLHARAGTLLAAGAAVGFTAVFVTSLWRGTGGATTLDWLVLGIAGVGLCLWQGLDRPEIALLGVITAEAGAAILTCSKAFRSPRSETASTWVIDAAAGLVGLTAGGRSLSTFAYPLSHTVLNLAVLGAIVVGSRRRTPALATAGAS